MTKNEIVHYPHGEGGSVFLHERTSLKGCDEHHPACDMRACFLYVFSWNC